MDAAALSRFDAKYSVTEAGCWIWTAVLNRNGYGRLRVGGSMLQAHRLAYEHFVGPIPTGMQLDHICHTRDSECPGGECIHRRCVNPEHLEPVDGRTNTLRGRGLASHNADKSHCKHGHEFTPENTYIRVGRYGRPERHCRACALLRMAARRRALSGGSAGGAPGLATSAGRPGARNPYSMWAAARI